MGLFDRFRSKPRCPVDPDIREWIDRRWRWLEGEFGEERPRSSPVVLPRPEFFPDPYRGTEADARRLLDRVCGYMDIEPDSIEMALYDESHPMAGSPLLGEYRHQGSAGLYELDDGTHRISIEESNLGDPLAMVATMAHELGHVHLLGHGRLTGDEEDHEPLTDLLTVFFGLGVFTANSVIRESSWTDGNYSGWSVGRRGYLSMPMYGYALAALARSRGEDGSAWSRALRLDVLTPFKEAMRFLAAEGA